MIMGRGVGVVVAAVLAALVADTAADVTGVPPPPLEGEPGSPGGLGPGRLGSPSLEPVDRPNLLVIMTDDQRADAMDVMPRTRRWFDAGGTTFTSAFAATPLCRPSRATVFTGRYAHNHGVRSNHHALDLRDRSTVQRSVQEHGYRTALIGKYLNRWGLRRPPPHFDRWVVPRTGYEDLVYNTNGERRRIRGYATDILADQAVRQLERFARSDRPWLMFITPFAPHGPFTPAPRHRGAPVGGWGPNPAVRDVERVGKPQDVLERSPARIEKARSVRRRQLRTLLAVDQLVARVMRELHRSGEGEQTLSVFTSDNGFLWGEFGMFEKHRPYDPAARVPMYLRWPGRVPAGARDHRLVSNVDLAPTMLDAAMVQPRGARPLDGHSLLGDHVRSRILLEYFRHPSQPRLSWASIRTPSVHYTEYYRERPGGGEQVAFREYYDLGADRWQLVNLLQDGDPSSGPSPQGLGVLARFLADARACAGATGPTACP